MIKLSVRLVWQYDKAMCELINNDLFGSMIKLSVIL